MGRVSENFPFKLSSGLVKSIQIRVILGTNMEVQLEKIRENGNISYTVERRRVFLVHPINCIVESNGLEF